MAVHSLYVKITPIEFTVSPDGGCSVSIDHNDADLKSGGGFGWVQVEGNPLCCALDMLQPPKSKNLVVLLALVVTTWCVRFAVVR